MKTSLRSNYKYSIKTLNILLEAVTCILIVLWIYVGITKLIDWRSFSFQMATSPIFKDYAQLITFGVPISELAIALLLITKKTRKIGLILSAALMALFTVYVAYLMIYIPNLPCSCGGIISTLNWTQHLILNIVLTSLSVLGIYIHNLKRKSGF